MSLKKKFGVGFIILCLSGGGYTIFKSMKTNVSTKESSPILRSKKESSVLSVYANIALSNFTDSKKSAVALRDAIEALIANPTDETLKSAKTAYVKAREFYQQTEAFRFGNPKVDAFEGKVNAWPLDEGLIDYVDASYGKISEDNPFYTANIIGTKQIKVAGQLINASIINGDLLRTFQEIDEVESNVATGYHAIEFLLWGQDLNGNEAGAGMRPASDYAKGANCTGGNCDRRSAYLMAAVNVLIEDLTAITDEWAIDGQARKDLELNGISAIATGLGSLAYGELAGERTKLGLMLGDPEEEHDCFSDLTHVSHLYNAQGIKNVYYGQYKSSYGNSVEGVSIRDLVMAKNPDLGAELDIKVEKLMKTAEKMYDRAEGGEAFDMMIAKGNTAGNKTVQNFIDASVDFSKLLKKSLAVLKLDDVEFEGSDSLDNPGQVGS